MYKYLGVDSTSHLLHYSEARHTVLPACKIIHTKIFLWVIMAHPLSCKRSKKELNCLKVASTASSICSSPDRQTFHQKRGHELFAMDVCSLSEKLT